MAECTSNSNYRLEINDEILYQISVVRLLCFECVTVLIETCDFFCLRLQNCLLHGYNQIRFIRFKMQNNKMVYLYTKSDLEEKVQVRISYKMVASILEYEISGKEIIDRLKFSLGMVFVWCNRTIALNETPFA